MNIPELKELCAAAAPYVRGMRERLHTEPELGTEEWKTAAMITEQLRSFGCTEIRTGIVRTGVMATIRGEMPGPVILLRVDMDALLIDDQSSAGTRKIPCHCCGHDVHTALGLGAAKILMQSREQLHGTIKIFFQPSEERPIPMSARRSYDCYTEPPVGKRGACAAVEEGILQDPEPDRVLGIHCWPLLQAGKIGYEYGTAMSGTGNFHLAVLGKSGHAGMPHKAVDSIVTAAEIVEALQALISRKRDPSIPAVMNIGTIKGGTRRSVVCSRVDMAGTVRCPDTEYLSEVVPHSMEQIIRGVCEAMGAEYIFEYGVDQPPVVNDEMFVRHCASVLGATLGERAVELRECPMTAEDFSFLSQKIPALYLKLGTAGGPETAYPLHNPNFDVDTACFETGLLGVCSILLDHVGALK